MRFGGRGGATQCAVPTPINKTRCFETFPFPVATDDQKARIHELGERLGAHRKRQQSLHLGLTITQMYNVLEKLRSGGSFNKKEQAIQTTGLVGVLREIHDELDAAVAEAYGWPVELADEAILERLVTLNHARAQEEAQGVVRWLRPDYQAPEEPLRQPALVADAKSAIQPQVAAPAKKRPWPKRVSEQIQALCSVLDEQSAPIAADDLAGCFSRARKAVVQDLLDTLVALGQVHRSPDDRYRLADGVVVRDN